MKKTISVNLGNLVFNIDEDAYLVLKEYLNHIESHFSDEKEREDIINDIELRISELFAERMGLSKQVITIRDVEDVIKIMGDPSEIGGSKEPPEDKTTYRSETRRIYRDPDSRILGGVCGGLGSYLGIDPVVIRILFVLIFFGFGFGLLIYIILWIAIPEAKTTAQKLEMRGDTVNASNIGKFVKDEFENVKKSFRRKKNN
jgi:phage shock protein PspC (stress-responsive transcriptional regulator)